jgi:hypothetical protein
MSTTIHDSLYLAKKELLDARLSPVNDVINLPTLNSTSSYIPEGATILVRNANTNYQAQRDPFNLSNLIWVNIGDTSSAMVIGTINIAPTTTTLDLSVVTPPISTCHSVIVNIISGGINANINNIINFPSNQNITFYVSIGQQLIFTHTDYDAPGLNTIVIEDGFNFNMFGRADANESITLKKSANKICQVSATQYVKKSEIQQLIVGALSIIDNLTTNDPNKALSAAQGFLLNNLLTGKMPLFNLGNHVSFSGSSAPFNLNSIPFKTRRVQSLTSDFLTAAFNELLIQPVDNDYYRIYFNNSEGSFILPPGEPSVIGFTPQWTQISGPIISTSIINLPDASVTSFNSWVVGASSKYVINRNEISFNGNVTKSLSTGSSSISEKIFQIQAGRRPSNISFILPVSAFKNGSTHIESAFLTINVSGEVFVTLKDTFLTSDIITVYLDNLKYFTV